MIVHFILSVAALAHASPHAVFPAPLGSRVAPASLDEEFDKRLADAGSDVEKLWQLHLWCKETSRSAESRTVLKKVIELSPDHQDARKALGHHFYDNQWFETYTALAKYKRDQEAKLFLFTLKHSIGLTIAMGFIAMLFAYVLTDLIPQP